MTGGRSRIITVVVVKNGAWKLWKKTMECEYETGYMIALHDDMIAFLDVVSHRHPKVLGRRRIATGRSITPR